MIKKVGGIWFWKVGRVGGSFHVSRQQVRRERQAMTHDWFGLAACCVLLVSAVL